MQNGDGHIPSETHHAHPFHLGRETPEFLPSGVSFHVISAMKKAPAARASALLIL
jgi:hypothetical protein